MISTELRSEPGNLNAMHSKVQKADLEEPKVNTVLEQLLFALHQLSALNTFKSLSSECDLSRAGIIMWYYGIYAASSAMIAAKDGSFQEDHTSTANVWDSQIAAHNLMPPPFGWRVPSLVKKDSDLVLSKISSVPQFELSGHPPETTEDALGACRAYLSGCVNWYRWKTEEDIKASREFRDANYDSFRTSAAKELRDRKLVRKSVSFVHQASRYRGKANYREALFLGYGSGPSLLLPGFSSDLSMVLDVFLGYAGRFCAKRIGKDVWLEFIQDLEARRSFTTGPTNVFGWTD